MDLFPFLALIGLVMGSIYGGVATPTEAGAIGVVSALVIAASYRSLSVRILRTALHRTLVMSGNILFIVFVSMIFAYATALCRVRRNAGSGCGMQGFRVPVFSWLLWSSMPFSVASWKAWE